MTIIAGLLLGGVAVLAPRDTCLGQIRSFQELPTEVSPLASPEQRSSLAMPMLDLVVHTGPFRGSFGSRWVVVETPAGLCLASGRSDLASRYDRVYLTRMWNREAAPHFPEDLDRETSVAGAALFITYLLGQPVDVESPLLQRVPPDGALLFSVRSVAEDGDGRVVEGVLAYGFDQHWAVRVSRSGFSLLREIPEER